LDTPNFGQALLGEANLLNQSVVHRSDVLGDRIPNERYEGLPGSTLVETRVGGVVRGAIVELRRCRHSYDVTNAFRIVLRWFCILSVSFTVAFILLQVVRRSDWFKERLYRDLVSGDENTRLRAASVLASVGGEPQLLRALKSADERISEMARRGLDHLWFHAAGKTAYGMMETAYALAEDKKYAESLEVLDRLLARYPNYAEALNRRAAAAWQLGEYEKSRLDCERALAINPNHYGAWQGLGIAQLQTGDVAGACRSLRTALRISPNDRVARRCLKKVEDLMRALPGNHRAPEREADAA
jgi:tetratricopeptide (TPR) repeat protein